MSRYPERSDFPHASRIQSADLPRIARSGSVDGVSLPDGHSHPDRHSHPADGEFLASRQELRSLNDELTALNGRLRETLDRHRSAVSDLQNVLYSTDVATLLLDLDMNIRFFNPAAQAIFRVIASDVGRPLADLAAASLDDELTADAHAVLETADANAREVFAGEGRWFLRRIQPYRADGGRVDGVVITYVDITERKRINAALVAAKRQAERATAAKSRLLAAASHDLRQPLQSLALLHGMIARGGRPAAAAQVSTLLDQTLKSMTDMLDSLLDVNRIETGVIRPDMRPVALGPLMQRLAEEFGPLCDQKGLKLRAVPSTAWVRTDPKLLEQILRNLLSNALKYTREGGILFGCRRRGAHLAINVCDSGIGVAEADAHAIFDPYRQLDDGAALAGDGLGLGLSIVQQLAHLMDHPVNVRSRPGQGSVFTIMLPVVEAVPESRPEAQATALAGLAPQTGTVLLVEEDAALRDLLTDVLGQAGHTVVAKPTSQAALVWAGAEGLAPDLLLTDLHLPGAASGLTLADEIAAVTGGAVPTIILTGDITSATRQEIAEAGACQVVKPVMPHELLDRISGLMHLARAEREAAARRAAASDTSVHVIDDDPRICETARRVFEAEGWTVSTWSSAEDFLAAPRPRGRTCLLVDGMLPGMDGVSLIAQLRAEASQLPAVVFTGHGDAAMAVAALKAGASDLIEKPASAEDLVSVIRGALVHVDDDLVQAATRDAARKRFSQLTARERDVLTRVLEGAPNKIIAADLGINQRTVENHRAAVMRKTGAESLSELVRLALTADPWDA